MSAAQLETGSTRAYVRDELIELRAHRAFDYVVEGAMAPYGPLGADRAGIVRERIDQLITQC